MTENAPATLADHALVLDTTDPGAATADLTPLAERFGDADVVGLGEATHGTREFFELRHRLTHFLVEECGVRTVAIEAEAGSVAALERFVHDGEGDPDDALAGLRPWWRTEGMRSFLRWLRAFDRERPPEERVRLYGVDVGDPTAAATTLRSFLRGSDREVDPVLDELADGAAERRGPDDGEWFERAAAVARDVAEWIDGRDGSAADPWRRDRLAHLARGVAGSCEWYRDGGTSEGFSVDGYAARDRVMAANAARIARRRPGGVALWAHNGHLKRGTFDDGRPWSDRETAGQHLSGALGDGYRPIATTFGSGRFRAIDASAADRGYDTFEAAPPPADALSAHLGDPGETVFLDLAAASEDPELAAWLDSRRIRNVEAAYDPEDDHEHFVETDLGNAFDGVVFLEETTPARAADLVPGE